MGLYLFCNNKNAMTNYELFQLERYGNVLPESDADPILLEEDEMIIHEFYPEIIQDNKFDN